MISDSGTLVVNSRGYLDSTHKNVWKIIIDYFDIKSECNIEDGSGNHQRVIFKRKIDNIMTNIEEIKNFVIEGYRKILLREPDPRGLNHYIDEISSGRITKEKFLEILRTSREYRIRFGYMSIGWVTDFTIDEHRGGAQQTNHEMVIAGRLRGHIIDYITFKNFSRDNINKYDMLIINRVQTFGQDAKKLMIRKNYVKYEHDYDCIMSDSMCKDIYENSLLNIFLSPLHYKTFNEYYKKKYDKNIERIYLQPSPVIGFKKLDKEPIKNTVIWVGDLQRHKGVDNVIEYVRKRKDLKFDLYILNRSHTEEIAKIKKLRETLNNISVKNEIKDKKEMSKIYSGYEYFIHLPIWKEPFGRAVLEAYLSGCKLIINENVGMMSYGWNVNNYDDIVEINNKAIENFWNKIENIIRSDIS